MRFKDEDASLALVGATRLGRLLLGSVVSLITPSLASAAVTIAITTPPPGQPVTNPAVITVTYSSSGPALDLASFRAHVNGIDWTDRFEVGPGSASYILSPADQLIAGALTIQAEIRDTATPPASGLVTQSYDVLPSLQAVSPSTVVEAGRLTVGALGLDPDPADNKLVFPSLFGGEATAPFISVDRDLNQGVADLPDGAMTGPLRIRVNDRTSPQSLDVTVLPAYLECGPIYRFHSLPNGRFLVLYASIFPFPPPGCPTSVPAGRRAAVLLYPEGTSVTLATGYASGGFIRQVEEIAVDKTGQYMAVILRENEPTERLFIQYRNRTTSIPLPGPRIPGPHPTAHPIAADFDVDGNLYVAVLDPQTHLVRVPAAALAVGGPVVPGLVADGLDVRNTPGCADGLHLVVSCDGHAYVAIQNHLNSLHPPGMCPSDEWMRWNQGIIRKIDLATGAVVSDLNTDNGFMYDIVHTCRTDEIFGVSYSDYNFPVPGDVWRSVEGGPPTPVFHMPFLTAEALTIGPTGKVYISWWESPRRYLISIPYRVEDCQGCGPGEPCPALSAPQPYCLSPLLYPIRIRPETTRWRPQRSTAGTVEVHFDGPQGLTPQTTLLISGPNGALTGQNLAFEVVDGQSDPARYKITWSGPWQTGTPPAYLPRGDYRVVVRGVMPDDRIVTSSPSDANSTVSLVEVMGVELLPALNDPRGPGALSANPGVATIADQNPAQDRPAEGKRIFAEALSSGGAILNKVRIRATVSPAIPNYRGQAPVTVYFRSLDVDDPARRDPRTGAPNPADRDLDNLPLVVIDNRGTPVDGTVAPREVNLAAGQTIAEAELTTSLQPGDNYRVMATTSATWRLELMGYQPSQDGEVRRLDGSPTGATLTEGERQTLSPMLTVWRTLHLEVDSMTPPPGVPPPGEPAHPERNYIAGRVSSIDQVAQVPGIGPRPTRLWLVPDATTPPVELRDGSPDLDAGGGRGRFEKGTLLIGTGSAVVKLTGLYGNGVAIETSSRGADVGFELARGTNRLTGYVLTWDRLAQAFEVDRSVGDSVYDGGTITVAGTTWTIQTARGTRVTVVEDHLLPFHLADDDASPHPYEVRSTLLTDCRGQEDATACEADSARNILAQACVRVLFDLPSNGRIPAFVRNVGESDAETIAQLAAGRDDTTVDSPSFWVGYLQGAFQQMTYLQSGNDVFSDGDPDVEHYATSILGANIGTGALIFVEATRDAAAWPLRRIICGPDDGEPLSIAVAHEVGHQFGVRHHHGAIMADGCPRPQYFSAEALDVIRSRSVP